MSCCTKCCSDTCIQIDPRELRDLLYKVDYTLADISRKMYNHLKFKHPYSSSRNRTFDRLTVYKRTLDRHLEALQTGSTQCLCDDDFQSVLEETRLLVIHPKEKCKLGKEVDSSGRDDWIMNNPYCVSREKWEKFAYRVCSDFNMVLTRVDSDQVCNLVFELTRKTFSCELLAVLSVAKEACKLGLTVNRSPDECQIDYQLLRERHSCDLTYNQYLYLVSECNLSFDIISKIMDQGVDLEVDPTCNEATIATSIGRYSLDEFEFKTEISDFKIFGEKVYIDKEHLLSDYN